MTDQVRPEEVADLLDDAADVLEKEGWIQGNLARIPEGFCVLGALGHARGQKTGKLIDFDEYSSAAERLLARQVGTLSTWNDWPGRTQQEVLDLLRLTAKEARS